VLIPGGEAEMTDRTPDDPAGDVVEQLRRLWVMTNEESIGADIVRARALAESAPSPRRAEADEFVLALQRLERWLRDF
jgi:hypothetical protein